MRGVLRYFPLTLTLSLWERENYVRYLKFWSVIFICVYLGSSAAKK